MKGPQAASQGPSGVQESSCLDRSRPRAVSSGLVLVANCPDTPVQYMVMDAPISNQKTWGGGCSVCCIQGKGALAEEEMFLGNFHEQCLCLTS